MRRKELTPFFLITTSLALLTALLSCRQETVTEHMHEHWSRSLAVRDAVLLGKLAQAKKDAAWLADHPAPRKIAKDWGPYVVEMKRQAASIVKAKDISTAARHVPMLAMSCGRCHAAAKATVKFSDKKIPPLDQSRISHMRRHLRGVETMWRGLVADSSSFWQEGALMLDEKHLGESYFRGLGKPAGQLLRHGKTVHDRARDAFHLTEPQQKAEVLGEIMAACGNCHAAVKKSDRK